MNHTHQETQAWHDACVAKFASPDGTVETIGGKDWARMHPMRCPCGRVFYGWAPLDNPPAPYQLDPGPGQRQTCGHPFCHKAEEDFARNAVHLTRGPQ